MLQKKAQKFLRLTLLNGWLIFLYQSLRRSVQLLKEHGLMDIKDHVEVFLE